ncbi:MAG: HemX protein [Sedimenticola thiotaurini]|uniref:HemX protein n=1 Tax=Sedimenticola thiotaurini TaxID=1543721 RepID=A0A558DFL0_9GAMM|nr:MAG: HemX protein [Sedimenticola thiotaurini]
MSNKDAKDSGIDDAAVVEAESQIEDAEIIESTPLKETPERQQTGNSQKLPLIMAVVAILLVFGTLGYGYQYWSGLQASLQQMNQALGKAGEQQQQLQSQLATVEKAFERQKDEIATQQSALAAQDQKLTAERDRLSKQASEMKQSLESVYSKVGRSSNAWMAAEAEYLMRVANHRLRLEGDVRTAIAALEAADGRLRDTGDPGLIEVREVLAGEIATLKSVGPLDRVGLSARITGLIGQVKGLKMVGLEYSPSEPEKAKESTSEGERSVQTLLKDGWEGFKSVMVIRHRDKPVSAMLAPEQQFFVYKNLELQLEAARLALLKGDPELFATSLKQATVWVGDFFDADAVATQAVQKEIADLATVNVRPQLPDISKSLTALQARMKAAGEEGAQ